MPDYKKYIENLKTEKQYDNQDTLDLSATSYTGNDSLEKREIDKTITKNYEPSREYLGGKDRYIDPNSTSPTISNDNIFKTISIVVIVIIGIIFLRKLLSFFKK